MLPIENLEKKRKSTAHMSNDFPPFYFINRACQLFKITAFRTDPLRVRVAQYDYESTRISFF
jgi:hypothetical protein